MKRAVKFIAAALCLLLVTPAAANDQMDFLTIENRMQEDLLDFQYSYPQITKGESRLTEQRLNGYLREYSEKTAYDARLFARKQSLPVQGSTTFLVTRNDADYFSIFFTTSTSYGLAKQEGFVFFSEDGKKIRLFDLFVSDDSLFLLEQQIASWKQAHQISAKILSNQSFYLTEDALVLIFAAENENTKSVTIPFSDIRANLNETLLKSLTHS